MNTSICCIFYFNFFQGDKQRPHLTTLCWIPPVFFTSRTSLAPACFLLPLWITFQHYPIMVNIVCGQIKWTIFIFFIFFKSLYFIFFLLQTSDDVLHTSEENVRLLRQSASIFLRGRGFSAFKCSLVFQTVNAPPKGKRKKIKRMNSNNNWSARAPWRRRSLNGWARRSCWTFGRSGDRRLVAPPPPPLGGTTSQVSSRPLWNIFLKVESQVIQLAIMDIFLDFYV